MSAAESYGGPPHAWQAAHWEQLINAWQAGRLAHALMLQGPRGLGKEAFARRLFDVLLTAPSGAASDPGAHARHPDFLSVSPAEGKTAIGVEQIRELGEHFALTSHGSGLKCALISPAQSMTTNAANSLLKTLEEPAGASLLVLTVPGASALPATVASRCLRIRFAVPPKDVALEWLEAVEQRPDWSQLLDFAAGAPLRALALAREDFPAVHQALTEDLVTIINRRTEVTAVAGRWARATVPQLRLEWLGGLTCALIRSKSTDVAAGYPVEIKKYIENIKIMNLYEYLDQVYRVTAAAETSMNLQLAFESLLIPWCHGLENSVAGHTI